MKNKVWVNPNKMLFESLHKEFNRQTRCITIGNQIADTVCSAFIREVKNCECNGVSFNPGELQEYDLNWLVKEAPDYTKNWIRKHKDKCIMYVFFHMLKNKTKKIDGVVITATGDDNYDLLKVFYVNDTEKGRSAIDEATKYITERSC